MQKIESGIYKHFKGMKVLVLGVAKHSETLEDLVVYVELENEISPLWVRPVEMFLEKVEVNGKLFPRFKKMK